jgi:CxxC motif-containing protein
MTKRLTCIECPKGCLLSIDIENCRVAKVSGNECPKGEKYAVQEAESPMRTLTSAVLTEGLSLKMVPVRTDKPIPKSRIMEAMGEIKNIRLKSPVKCGFVIVENFLDLGVNLLSTRSAS